MTRGALRRVGAGAIVALFFVLLPVVPAQAVPEWKEAIDEIEEIRNEAMQELDETGSGFLDFLDEGPTADGAADELGDVHASLRYLGEEAVAAITSIMNDFPRFDKVQQAGTLAIGLINATESFWIGYTTYQYDQYIAGLPEEPPPSTTTTSAPPATTTTTAPPATTTTTAPPATTTTTASPATTTTTQATTTTTLPIVTTTSPTAPPSETTTTTTAQTLGVADVSGEPPEAFLGGGISEPAQTGNRFGTLDLETSTERGFTASLTRVLEPLVPTQVADVVMSPLLVFELLWRAISTSGRGLVAPISLLAFTILSLLWDKRKTKGKPSLLAGSQSVVRSS